MTEDKNTQVHEEPQVMSETDVHDFQGLTLNENGQEERSKTGRNPCNSYTQSAAVEEDPVWDGLHWLPYAAGSRGLVCFCRIGGNTGRSGSGLCSFQTVSINR